MFFFQIKGPISLGQEISLPKDIIIKKIGVSFPKRPFPSFSNSLGSGVIVFKHDSGDDASLNTEIVSLKINNCDNVFYDNLCLGGIVTHENFDENGNVILTNVSIPSATKVVFLESNFPPGALVDIGYEKKGVS